MRGERRRRVISGGTLVLVCVLAGSALMAMVSGRLGWKNYWGGFVYAPIALGIVILFVIAVLNQRGRPPQ
jgi:hypothetical protein